MLHVLDGEQTQFLQLAPLTLKNIISRFERCTTERATVVTLQRERTIRDEMTTWKGRTREPCFLASQEIDEEGEAMVYQRFARGNIPPLHKRCPIQFHSHHLVDALRDVGESANRHHIQGMKQFLADAESVLFQSSHECRHRHRNLRLHVHVLMANVEEHSTVAQRYLGQSLVVHLILNIRGN